MKKLTLPSVRNREIRRSLAFFCLLLGGCSSTSVHNSQIKLSQDTYVTQGTQPRTLNKKGEMLTLTSESPVLLESPGYVGLLLVPMKNAAGQLEPHLKPIDGWSGDVLEKALNTKLNELVEGTNQVQVLLSTKREKEALEKVDALQRKYPKVTFLNFFRASALFMLGEREKTKMVLKDVLQEFPDHEDARNFYKSIGGTR